MLNDLESSMLKFSVSLEERKSTEVCDTQAQLCAAIRSRPKSDQKVNKILAHHSLPIIALVQADLIDVYRLEENIHPNVHEADFQLHGRWTTANILDTSWVGDLD